MHYLPAGQNPQSTVPDYYFTKPLDRPGLKPLENCLPAEYKKRGRDADAPSGSNGTVNGSVLGDTPKIRKIIKRVLIPRPKSGPSSRSPWCKPTTRRRRYKHVTVYIDEHGNEIPDPNAPEEKEDAEKDDDESSDEDDTKKSRSSPRGRDCSPRAKGKNTPSPRGRSPRESGASSGRSRSPGRSPRGRSKSPKRSPSTRGRSPGRKSRSRSRSPAPGRGANKNRSNSKSPDRSPASSRSPRSKPARGESPSSGPMGVSIYAFEQYLIVFECRKWFVFDRLFDPIMKSSISL